MIHSNTCIAVQFVRGVVLAGLLFGLFVFSNEGLAEGAQGPKRQAIADAIRNKFESRLFSLPPNTQAHYATRLYRMTGDIRYAYPSLLRLYRVSDQLEWIVENIDRKDFVTNEVKNILKKKPKTQRGQRRRDSLKGEHEFLFYAGSLLHYMHNLHDFGMKNRRHDRLIETLKKYDFAKYLLDKDVVAAWAAMAANYVYWLNQLGVTDLRAEFKIAFREAFPDSNDANIDSGEFCHKIYGLTHFIIAASRYYQQPVDDPEFSWILDYFDSRLGRIMQECKADVLAEVGVSILLAERKDGPAVTKLRDSLIKQFNPDYKMILSVDGSNDLEGGEHRNVLTYMFLAWPRQLHSGPNFMEIPQLRKYMPHHVVEREK